MKKQARQPSFPGFDEAPAEAFPSEIAINRRFPQQLSDYRRQLRARFMSCESAATSDQELLELTLFRALPRLDVRPLAHSLLTQFGDLNGVITAPAPRLYDVPGITAAVLLELKLLEATAQRLARSKILNKNAISSWDALLDYCHTVMAHREIEQFRVFFLDRKNILIADEAQAKGTVDHVPVYPREIAKRALELNASALILVHNHPSGDPTPSDSDIDMTNQVDAACSALGLTLHDHIIVGKSREISFRAEGLL